MGRYAILLVLKVYHVYFTISYQTRVHNMVKLEMRASAQRDGRPAEHRWRPLFNAAKFG